MKSAHVAPEYSFEDVCNIVRSVAEKYGVEKVFLFGSRARGDNSKKSDYDFIIVPGKLRGLIELSGFIIDLADALGTEVDVIPEAAMDEDFSREVLQDRRTVYEA